MPKTLDFIIIGAQKGGTTSLWRYLRQHPKLALVRSKEAPFFSKEGADRPGELDSYMRRHFDDAPAGALFGKATTSYMMGVPGADVGILAERISKALPRVKLMALLRDPIERAISGYTMAVRRGQEKRALDVALGEVLLAGELANARLNPTPINSYIALGEYGRILKAYRSCFPPDQMKVLFTQDLERRPEPVFDSVLTFLGMQAGFRPKDLGKHYFRGGAGKRLDPQAESVLFNYLRTEIIPKLRSNVDAHIDAFMFFYQTWNVIPGDPPMLSDEIRRRLEDHFRDDAQALVDLGVSAPWIAKWDHR